MEAIHKPSHRAWIDHKIINVRQFLDEWTNELSLCEDMYAANKSLKSTISEEEYRSIEEECGLDALKCDYQDKVEPADRITVPEDVHLQTVRHQAEELEKRATDKKYLTAHLNMMKYCNYPPHKTLNLDSSDLEFAPVDTPEVLLIVQIYKPERRLDPNAAMAYTKFPSFHVEQEFYVLGNQYLTELRDKIDCISDKTFPGDLSDCPTALPSVSCKDLYKSGFFYIGGIFHNDMRDKDCRDYSDTIIKWSKKGNRGIGPFKKAQMEKTRFIDLTIQLGYPYVYVHQGECEHLIVFADLRLFSKHDVQNRNAYPMYVQIRPTKRIFCMVCHTFTAQWIVYGNKRLPENPFFFCKTCFFSFNYDKNGQKIGDFKAYYYPDRTTLS